MQTIRRGANKTMSEINEALMKSILRKVHNSEPLNDEERHYRNKMFDDMMSSKKIVQKTVRILTGEELRKERNSELKKESKVWVDPTRKDPRYPQGKNPAKIEGEKTNPKILRANAKILDADIKPKQVKTEGERLGAYTQNPIMPRSEAAKFVSLDPVHAGDIVIKNFASSGQMLIKGVVLNVDEKHGTATVKWAHGRTSHEFSHTLVKAKKNDKGEDPKLGVPKKEEDEKNPPMKKGEKLSKQGLRERGRAAVRTVARTGRRLISEHKQRRAESRAIAAPGRHARRLTGPGTYFRAPAETAQSAISTIRSIPAARAARAARRRRTGKMMKDEMTPQELERSKRLAEKLKGKKGIGNPHALARHMVQQKFTKADVKYVVHELAKQVREKARQTARSTARSIGQAARRAGRAVGQAALGGGRAAVRSSESTYRRGRAARTRRQVMRQPAQHGKEALRQVGRAISPSPFKTPQERTAHLREAGRSAARAVGSVAPARRARRMHREAKTQFGMFGPKVKRPYGQKQKVQKDGDIASVRENIPMPIGGNTPTPTPFEDLTTVLQQTIDLAAQVKQKRNRNADEDVKTYYNKILVELRGISERLLAALSMELNEAKAEYNNSEDDE